MSCSRIDLVDLAWYHRGYRSVCKVHCERGEIRVEFAAEAEEAGGEDIERPICILAERRSGKPGHARGAARIVEDQTLKALEPFRVELAQCFDEGALPNAGRTAQNHETPTRLRHQSPHLSVLSVPVNPLELGLRFEKPFVHFYSTFARALAKICRAHRLA